MIPPSRDAFLISSPQVASSHLPISLYPTSTLTMDHGDHGGHGDMPGMDMPKCSVRTPLG
jgi:hypothetical protein